MPCKNQAPISDSCESTRYAAIKRQSLLIEDPRSFWSCLWWPRMVYCAFGQHGGYLRGPFFILKACVWLNKPLFCAPQPMWTRETVYLPYFGVPSFPGKLLIACRDFFFSVVRRANGPILEWYAVVKRGGCALSCR